MIVLGDIPGRSLSSFIPWTILHSHGITRIVLTLVYLLRIFIADQYAVQSRVHVPEMIIGADMQFL